MKQKKQFRLFDLYRYVVTKERSNIKNIVAYDCNADCSVIEIFYAFPSVSRVYYATNEEELKQVISEINKFLGTCRKPGPRKGVTK